MRTIPRTPVALGLWLVCIAAVLVMVGGHPIAGLAVMAIALTVAVGLRLAGLR